MHLAWSRCFVGDRLYAMFTVVGAIFVGLDESDNLTASAQKWIQKINEGLV
jgi:uncharacterized membrane protein